MKSAAKFFHLFLSGLVTFSFVTFISSETTGQNVPADRYAAEDLNRRGVWKTNQKEYPEAITLLTEAVAADPGFAKAVMNLGSAYMLNGQPEIAVGHLQRSLQLDPKLYQAHNQLGVTYDKLNKTGLALASLKKSIELKPDYALAHYNLGSVYLWDDKIKQAVPELELAERLDPANAEIKHYLSAAYARLNRYPDAIRTIKKVTTKDAKDETANLLLCNLYLLANDRTSALEMYQSFKTVNISLAEQMFKSLFADNIIQAPKPLN